MKRCIECSKEFEPKHFNQKVCSEECFKARRTKLNRIATHNWYLNHKESKLLKNKDWRKNHPEQMRKFQKEFNERKRLELLSVLGDSCVVCGSKRYIQFHEVHGKKHATNSTYILGHIKDFVPLCGRCHRVKTRLLELDESQKMTLINL